MDPKTQTLPGHGCRTPLSLAQKSFNQKVEARSPTGSVSSVERNLQTYKKLTSHSNTHVFNEFMASTENWETWARILTPEVLYTLGGKKTHTDTLYATVCLNSGLTLPEHLVQVLGVFHNSIPLVYLISESMKWTLVKPSHWGAGVWHLPSALDPCFPLVQTLRAAMTTQVTGFLQAYGRLGLHSWLPLSISVSRTLVGNWGGKSADTSFFLPFSLFL